MAPPQNLCSLQEAPATVSKVLGPHGKGIQSASPVSQRHHPGTGTLGLWEGRLWLQGQGGAESHRVRLQGRPGNTVLCPSLRSQVDGSPTPGRVQAAPNPVTQKPNPAQFQAQGRRLLPAPRPSPAGPPAALGRRAQRPSKHVHAPVPGEGPLPRQRTQQGLRRRSGPHSSAASASLQPRSWGTPGGLWTELQTGQTAPRADKTGQEGCACSLRGRRRLPEGREVPEGCALGRGLPAPSPCTPDPSTELEAPPTRAECQERASGAGSASRAPCGQPPGERAGPGCRASTRASTRACSVLGPHR